MEFMVIGIHPIISSMPVRDMEIIWQLPKPLVRAVLGLREWLLWGLLAVGFINCKAVVDSVFADVRAPSVSRFLRSLDRMRSQKHGFL
jgi:hypothetical protein